MPSPFMFIAVADSHPCVAFLPCRSSSVETKPTAYPKQINTLGDHIRTRRLDLGLPQREVRDRIGMDGTTITNWERNGTVPAIRYVPAIIEFGTTLYLRPARSLNASQ
jgi:DNA-binding XRE family transcriptional regulator